MLQISKVDVYYGNVHALKDVTLHVNEGELVTLIGANGAGKSTVLKTLSGLVEPRHGEITFLGQRIDGRSVAEIVRRGLVHCPVGRRVFPDMTIGSDIKRAFSSTRRHFIWWRTTDACYWSRVTCAATTTHA